jgi:DNA-binding CsgD family transcriptional regulator
VLGISLHTCRGYVKSLLSKLGVSSQLEAVVTAQRLGLIDRSDGG